MTRAGDEDRLPLLLYLACLVVAVGLLLRSGVRTGPAAVAAAGLGMAAVGLGSLPRLRSLPLLPAGVAVLVGLAGWEGFTALRAGGPVWGAVLVALFAGRVAAEDNEARASRYWLAPADLDRPPHAQSTLSAVALGLALALAFRWLLPALSGWGEDGPAGRVVLGALRGETVVHQAIILLFFVVIGFVLDGALLLHQDRSGVEALRTRLRARGGAWSDADLVDALGPASRSRLLPQVDALAAAGAPAGYWSGGGARAAATLRHGRAFRTFVRALIPLLPLLGFLGTVIGLSTAIGELPRSLGAAQGEPVDIAASLGGLALKFETTLLGLLASMLASMVLALLERSEAELQARCALLLARAGTGAAHAA